MKKFFKKFLVVFLIGFFIFPFVESGYAQTTIFTNPGKSYTNIKNTNFDNYGPIDISNCSSVRFSFDFSFSLGWAGNGNMERPEECTFNGGCIPDVNMPTLNGCLNCWDFMYAEVLLDGVVVFSELIGDTGETRQVGTIDWSGCTDGASSLEINFINQNWANDETNTFSNITVLCWEPRPMATNNSPACDNVPINLTGTLVNPSHATSFGWSSTGSGTIDMPNNLITSVTGASSGDEFVLTVTDINGCTKSSSTVVTINPAQNADFNVMDFCGNTSSAPSGVVTSGGTFSFNPPPGDGATINPLTGVITNAVPGSSYDIQYVTPGPCPGTEIRTVNVSSGPEGTLSGSGILCPGECTTFSFSFNGGTPPYTISFNASPPGFPITVPGVDASTVFTICYTGLIPTFNPGNNTLNLPTFLTGTGTLVLTSISDASGCTGTVSGSYDLTLTPNPVAMTAGPLTACLDAFGLATFDLTTLDNTVNGGSGATVNWFTDAAGSNPITDPSNFQTSTNTTVYVSISNGNCTSARIPINLIVTTGSVGPVLFSCDALGSTDCSFCITSNSTTLIFTFTDGDSYEVTVENTSSGIISTGIVNNNTGLQVPINSGLNNFVLTIVNRVGSCPNPNLLNEMLTITVSDAPNIDLPTVPTSCNPYDLPPITGTNLSGNQGYYTGPGGTGSQLFEGQSIFTTQRIYIYDDFVGCTDEVFFDVTIIPMIVYDTIRNIKTCDFAILPPIKGIGITSTTKFYKVPLDNSPPFSPGDTIRNTITLTIFDPNVDNNCVGNNIIFTVTKNSLPTTPLLLRDCSGGAGNASIEITVPIGTRYEYSLNNGAYQSSNNYTGLSNNIYQVTVRDTITGCVSLVASIDVNCNCASSPTITTPQTSYTVCDAPASFQIAGIGFGGSATQVTVVSDGVGSLIQSTFLTSPFAIDYQVSPMDIGKIVAFTLSTDDPDGNGPCEATTRVINVNFIPSAVAGRDSLESLCQSALSVVNLNDYLQASINKSGEWKKSNTIVNPIDFDLNQLSIGNNDFFYIIGDPLCTLDTARVRFVVAKPNNAGNDNSLSICQNNLANVNFNALLGTFDAGGTWTQPNGTNLDFTQPNNVIISSLANGAYSFVYTTIGNACPSDIATITITVNAFNSAGPDILSSVCAGANVNVLDLVVAKDKSGTILFPNSVFGKFANGILNTTGLSDGDYLFKYFLVNNSPCRNDTSDVVIRVSQSLSAGTDVASSFCENAIIDLKSYLSASASPGGEFSLNGVLIPNGLYDSKNIGAVNQLIFTYTVGDGITCPMDAAIITLNKVAQPNLTLAKPKDICEGSCQDISITHNAGNGTLYISTKVSGMATTYKSTEVISGNSWTKNICAKAIGPFDFQNLPLNNKYIISLDSVRIAQGNGCVFKYNLRDSFSIKPLNTKMLSPILCKGETFKLANDIYSSTKLTGKTLVISTNANACDTIFNVNLSFRPDAVRNYRDTFCNTQGSITFGGTTFNQANPSGTALLPIKTAFGCDSTVNVQLTFMPIVINGSYTYTTCSDTYTYSVGSEVFGKNRPSGSVLIAGGSKNGCDSLVNVKLNFTEFVVTSATKYDCDEALATVNVNFASEPGPFVFTIDGVKDPQSQSLPFSKPFTEGMHIIIVETSDGCRDTLTLNISNNKGPDVILTQELLDDGSVQLNALADQNAIYDIVWSPSNSLSCARCLDPVANPKETTNYLFVYKYGEGCIDELSIRVDRINTDIVLPNIFSPNGDGRNEVFFVQLPDKVTGVIETMQIYDRWGNKVFSKDNFPAGDPTYGWDGFFNGRYVTPGVYTYFINIKVSGSGGNKIIKGDITVVR